MLSGCFLLRLELGETRALRTELLVQPDALQLVSLDLRVQGRESLVHLPEAARQLLDLGGCVGCVAPRVRRRPFGVTLRRAHLQLLLARPLGGLGGARESRLHCGELGERLLEPKSGVLARSLRLAHVPLEHLELGAPLQGSPPSSPSGGGAVQEHGTVRAPQRTPSAPRQNLVAREQGPHPCRRRAVGPQLVLQGMAVGREPRAGDTREQHQWAGLRLLMPQPDRLDGGRVTHQHRLQPFAQQPLGEFGVAAARVHEVGQRPDHGIVELRLRAQQCLRGWRESHTFALQLGERVPPRRHLRQRFLGPAPGRPPMRLLLLELRYAPARSLQRLRRLRRGAGLRGGARPERIRLPGRRQLRRLADRPFLHRLREPLP